MTFGNQSYDPLIKRITYVTFPELWLETAYAGVTDFSLATSRELTVTLLWQQKQHKALSSGKLSLSTHFMAD